MGYILHICKQRDWLGINLQNKQLRQFNIKKTQNKTQLVDSRALALW